MVMVIDEVERTPIQVTNTDGDPSTWPDTNLRMKIGYYVYFYYEVLESSNVYKQWMLTFGDVISDIDNTNESFVLQSLPPGYKLFFHAKFPASASINHDELPMSAVHSIRGDGSIERTDIYLYGLPNSRRFRSKNEFIPHFRWLYSGKLGICECKYCNLGTNIKRLRQKSCINKATSSKEVESLKDSFTDSNPDHETISSFLGPMYRPGEIIWVVGPNQNLMTSTSDGSPNGRDIKEYYNWPGYVVNIYDEQKEGRPSVYEVRLLALDRTRYYPESSLIPWIVREAKPAITSFSTDKLLDELFNRAIDIAIACQRTFIMNKEYKFEVSSEVIASTKDKEQKKRLRNAKKCPHYDEMIFGTEVIRTNDLVRLTVEDEEVRSVSTISPSKPQEMEFFRITTMYRLSNQQIQFSGDLYTRKNVDDDDDIEMSEDDERLQKKLTIGKYIYIPRNFPQQEFTVDMEDLAGRLYVDWDEITELMNLTEEKPSRDISNYPNELNYRIQIQEESTPGLNIGNHECYDDESDSQMSDIESLSTDSFFDKNNSFMSANETAKSFDNAELMMHQNSTGPHIYDPVQGGSIFPALHPEQSQDDNGGINKMDLRFLYEML